MLRALLRKFTRPPRPPRPVAPSRPYRPPSRRRWPSDEERYGLTSEQVAEVLSRNTCDVCGREWGEVFRQEGARPQQIDHCHTCERVRGALCHACNFWVVGHIENGDFVNGKRRWLAGRDYVLAGGALSGGGLGCSCDRNELLKRVSR